MAELTLQEKLRTAHVTRWQIVNVGRNQSVAEHSFLVQLIAVEISRIINFSNDRSGPFNTEKEHQIMRWAMWHDMMEVKTGDINTPTKMAIRKKLGEGEDCPIYTLEKSLSDEFTAISVATWPITKDIVKLADFAEALGFLEEEGKGRHAFEVRNTLREQMRTHFKEASARYPMYKWGACNDMLNHL